MQFADDFITIVRSLSRNSRSKTRVLVNKRRLLAELEQTKMWEDKWKIRSNPSKISIAIFGAKEQSLTKHGPITVNGVPITPSKVLKILGYNLYTHSPSLKHVKAITAKARTNLKKLNRFSSAPSRIKKIFYKSLIRPIIEYPCIPLALTSKTNIKQLQKVQNTAIRFIENVSLRDRIKMSHLHTKTKLPVMNIRMHKLAKKCLNTIINNYSANINVTPCKVYKFSDYTITENPIKSRKRPILQRINKYLSQNKKCFLYKLNKQWDYPDPIYT